MRLLVHEDPESLGKRAAEEAADWIGQCVREKGSARIVLSTGASQFEFFKHFLEQKVDWPSVEMFHLDEYIGLPASHPASFRKYLRERFVSKVALKAAYYVDGEEEPFLELERLERLAEAAPFDLGLIGIGENAHIAFNDPPADFAADAAYKVVALTNECKEQQVREGWFAGLGDVPESAITMTVQRILSCRKIISCVPHPVKADAVGRTLAADAPTPDVPASILKLHPDWSLHLDSGSAAGLPAEDVGRSGRTSL
ncbi:6-phosphogluconolactonase [Cohnella sp. JJ-181]|uniref:6-phosphogluconolactonase n=1 Tax=Cohnella rhizoplanae TaxID=2974897 RepID=UPI0022FF8C47|nr:6-phosphogluconolactonase [Cohnella sp. JJ-181]CAI6082986.1 Glucosamine-6-phosphate deaminase [Cohnella sp. JJ-181]